MKKRDVKALTKCEWYMRSYVNDTSDRVTDFGLTKIEITDGAYDVLLADSAGNEQLWSYTPGEYTCALLGEKNAMR